MTELDSHTNGADVIEVENVISHYGRRMILKGISVSVREGEIMVIMGGSGSGKSTLLRHMLALERPTEGTIRVLGRDLASLGMRETFELRKKLGVAFQGGALFSSMTVGENIMLPLYEHTSLDRTTMEIMARLMLPLYEHADLDRKTMEIMVRMKLEVVNLAGFENLMPSELSGGMIKRAAFARAIAMDPRILFCDEPSAGLDPVVSAAIDDLILRLRDAMGMSIVVVTHELESAFKIADRITVLDDGKVIFVGTVDEVRSHKSERIQNLLNRRAEDPIIDPDAYLRRLTGNDTREETAP